MNTTGAVIGAAALALGAGACAQQADGDIITTSGRPADFQATPEYLASAIDDSEGVPHRFDLTMEWEIMGRPLTPDEPIATGETDGERTYVAMDFGLMMETMAEAFEEEGEGAEFPTDIFGDDMSMEIVSDASTVYIRAPFLAAVGGAMTDAGAEGDFDGLPAEDMDEIFSALEDGWAKVDLTAAEGLAESELGPLLGSNQNMDPRVFLEMLSESESVEELGSDEIDGEPVTGMAASVTVSEMIEAQGLDVEEAFAAEDLPDEFADVFEDLQYEVEVWIDGDANIRRVVVDMGGMMEQIAEELDDAGEEFPGGDMTFRMTIDFFDYGDESIAVEFPENAVDITDQMVEALESAGG